MGIIRTWLAIVVMGDHLNVLGLGPYFNGELAVRCFYTISGFVMVVIWRQTYEGLGFRTFVTNRILRIYPAYFVALAMFIIGEALGSGPVTVYRASAMHTYSSFEIIVAGLANFTILGQDAVILSDPKHVLHDLIFIKQAWTIAIELLFYLTVPLIARRLWLVMMLMTLSVIAMLGGYESGLRGDWSNKFFAFEAIWFYLGAFAAHVYFARKWHVTATTGLIATGLYGAVTMGLPIALEYLPSRIVGIGVALPLSAICLVLTTGLLLIAFAGLNASVIDTYVGRWSYPIYLVHPLPIFFGLGTSITGVVLTVILAVPLVHVIEPLSEQWRRRNAPHTIRITQGTTIPGWTTGNPVAEPPDAAVPEREGRTTVDVFVSPDPWRATTADMTDPLATPFKP